MQHFSGSPNGASKIAPLLTCSASQIAPLLTWGASEIAQPLLYLFTVGMFNEIFFSEIDFLKGNEIWMHEKLPPFLNWQHHKLHHS